MVEEYPETDEEAMEEEAERQAEVYATPSYQQKNDLFSLFWRIVKRKDSSKLGNLHPALELGDVQFTVRDCQKIALLADVLGHKGFGDFFTDRGEITLSTSASKKGWLPELFVTRKEFKTRTRQFELQAPPQAKKKRKLFGGKEK